MNDYLQTVLIEISHDEVTLQFLAAVWTNFLIALTIIS